ncbi:hypothetical protein C483_03610 [Natrialba hulunbeirensis JCM 10989]|uniref:Uncharacterized protein n=1 Tax=Natrialba hulunbeirensis JCM 10989 TaxID=1227493 RepID=M0A636_9EURY|nr:hypothetical protein C483_03610 [Natrialba hulunbeirensis JCM 10989]
MLPVAAFSERTPTLRALLAGIGRFDCFDHDASQFRLVFGLFLQFAERPLLKFLVVADTLSNLL